MTPPHEAARPAVEADLPELARLEAAARAEVEPLRGGIVHLALEARPLGSALAPLLGDPERLVLVATLDDVVVGYLVAGLADGDAGLGLVAQVSDLFIEPDAREVGAGDALLTAASAWAQAKGCVGIDAFALPGARETKNFFEAHGFKARLLTVHHSFAPEPG